MCLHNVRFKKKVSDKKYKHTHTTRFSYTFSCVYDHVLDNAYSIQHTLYEYRKISKEADYGGKMCS